MISDYQHSIRGSLKNNRLKEQIRRRKEQIDRIEAETQEVKASFPYNKKGIS